MTVRNEWFCFSSGGRASVFGSCMYICASREYRGDQTDTPQPHTTHKAIETIFMGSLHILLSVRIPLVRAALVALLPARVAVR